LLEGEILAVDYLEFQFARIWRADWFVAGPVERGGEEDKRSV
jgi:hypothetical protein